MSRVPAVRSKELVAALVKAGFEPKRQSGSHLILKHPNGKRAVIPMHSGDLKRPTMLAIIRDAGLTENKLLDLL